MNLRLGKYNLSLGKKSVTARGNFAPATQNGYESESISDIYNTSTILAACFRVLQYTFWEPPLRCYRDEEEVSNPRLQSLLDNPNPNQSRSEFFSQFILYYSGWGNAYIQLARGAVSGSIKEMWCYSDDNMEPIIGNDGTVKEYIQKLSRNGIPQVNHLSPDEVIHFRSPIINPKKPHLGISLIRLAMQESNIDALLTRFLRNYIRNGAMPGTVGFLDEQYSNSTTEEKEEFKAAFKLKFGGEGYGDVGLLSGLRDIKTLVPPIKDFDTDKLRYFSENRIAGLLGVPARLAGFGTGKQDSTKNNTQQDSLELTQRTLVPMWKAVADKLTSGLARKFDPTITIGFDLSKVETLRIVRAEELKTYGDLLFEYQQAHGKGEINREDAMNAIEFLMGIDSNKSAKLFSDVTSLSKVAANPQGEIVTV